MLTIPATSAAAAAAASLTHTQEPATAPAPDAAHQAAAEAGDPPAKFDALFGAPPAHLAFHRDRNGAGGARAAQAGGGAAKAPARADPLAGAGLPGQKGIVILRSIGDAAGYETKNHAVAWARAAGSDRAMVVLGKDKRWHAVETSAVGKDAGGGTGAVTTAVQVGKVDRATYDRLRGEATKDNDRAKWKAFAAYALGIPESEIVVIGKGETPVSGKVNINLSPDFDAEGRTAGFDPDRPAWIQLGPLAFNRPANAVSTLAHEEVHAAHRRRTAELYTTYQHAHHGKESFREWAATHMKKDWRMIDIVAGYEDGTTGATELEAHVEAARVAFASGDLEQARTDLTKVRGLPNMPSLQTQLVSIAALRQLRDSLPADARAVFDEVARKARQSTVLYGL